MYAWQIALVIMWLASFIIIVTKMKPAQSDTLPGLDHKTWDTGMFLIGHILFLIGPIVVLVFSLWPKDQNKS